MNGFIVKNNKEKKRFETTINDQIAFLEYIPAGQNIVLAHTEVPVELEGQGVGSQLVKQALDEIKKEKRVLCAVVLIGAMMMSNEVTELRQSQFKHERNTSVRHS